VKKLFGRNDLHLEERFGTQLEAITYCQKDGEFHEWGTKKTQPKQSTRTDLEAFREAIKEGQNDLQLAESNLGAFARYPKMIDRMRVLLPPKRTDDNPIKVCLFIGLPDTGKTREAYAQFPDLYSFPIGKDLWSDGYSGQREVLVDDFAGEMRLVDLLRFLDRYPIQIPKKGGFNWWCPERVIVTTNIHPSDWYDYRKRKSSEKALRRRFHGVFDFDKKVDGQVQEVDLLTFWPIEGDIQPDSLELRLTPGDI